MKKRVLANAFSILFILLFLVGGNLGMMRTVAAQGNLSHSKVSSLLSLHTKMKADKINFESNDQEITPNRTQPTNDLSNLNTERIFIHFAQQPTDNELKDLASDGITVYPNTWIPPVGNDKTGFVLADMPVDKLSTLAGKSYVVSLDTAEKSIAPQNDKARLAMNVNPVWSNGDTGTGVTVAVLDSGLDTTNPDIPTPVASADYSNYPTIDSTIANTINGHGTHVTASLLGRGVNSATYKGVAPGASLVFIKIGNDKDGSARSESLTYAIRDAVDVYHAKIINISYGFWSEYHDGSDQICQAVDYATSKGTTVFAAAGNEASSGWHYSGTVDGGSTTKYIPITISSGSSYLLTNLVWYDGPGVNNNLDLQLYDSNYDPLTSETSGQSESSRGTESDMYELVNSVNAGTYYFRVQNTSSLNQTFHIYYMGGSPGVTFANPDQKYTVDSPAEADSAIAVGAYVTRNSWTNYKGSNYSLNPTETVGSVASFSSRGPRVDTGAPQKPEVVAPGSAIISAIDSIYTLGNASYDPFIIDDDGLNLDGSGPADYYVMEGTSMASPMAAGVGALLLSKNPGLTPAQIKHAIEETASSPYTPSDNAWGWGLVNADVASTYTTTLTSYSDITHNMTWANFNSGNLLNTIYLYGTGYLHSKAYQVIYYDGTNNEIAVDNVTTTVNGYLSSQHTINATSDAAGTWYTVVSDPEFVPPKVYNASWAFTIISGTFTVQESPIGSPTVFTDAATYTTDTETVLNGSLTDKGTASNVSVSFDWGTDTSYSGGNVVGVPSPLSAVGDFTANLNGLAKGHIYHFRVRADGGNGKVVTGQDMTLSTFTTSFIGKIAFASNQSGSYEIYDMNADGTNEMQLTNVASDNISPSWSPDGKKIVFESWRDGRCDIYVMNFDGTNVIPLTNNLASPDAHPSWSPDGSKIAFVGIDPNINTANIYVMNADGTNQTRLTNCSNNIGCTEPVWSPDGKKIAYVALGHTNQKEIFSMDADGSNQTEITNIPTALGTTDPSWSPDGMKFAFVSCYSASGPLEYSQIFLINIDGTDLTQITSDQFNAIEPTWSPDGTKIAFSSLDPYWIFIMNDDGANQVKFGNDSNSGRQPSWVLPSSKSNDATLSNLVLSDGTLEPAFDPGTFDYTASVENSVSSITVTPTVNEKHATVTVNDTAVDSGSASGAISLDVGNNTITIVVTAQDGTTKTYTVNVNRAAPAPSSDATLSNLVLSAGTLEPAFDPGTFDYTASVDNSVSSITVTPTVNEKHATVTVNDTAVDSGSASGAISLDVGNNTITIVVTAQDGTTKTYTVNVNRAAPAPSSDATLSNLVLSDGTLEPAFDPGTFDYTASVDNSVSSITVTPTVNEKHATVTVNDTPVDSGTASGAIDLDVGNNTITIVVTAQDGTTTNSYTVTITRAAPAPSSDATLSNLVLSDGTLEPAFDPGTFDYTASVENSVSSITVTPTVNESHATVTVNDTAVDSGSASGAIDLDVGDNTITMVVTAQDGTTTNPYTVTVTRAAPAPSSDATLSNLVLSDGTLEPTFDPGTFDYTASVENSVSSITVTPTVNESHATVTVNDTSVDSGTASGAIDLNVGVNTITIVVTAQDGTTKTYTVTVTRAAPAPSSDATLISLVLSAGTLNPTFTSETITYTASVENSVNSITVTPTVNESHATVTVNDTAVDSGTASEAINLDVGNNTITIVVTAQDGTTTNPYTLTVTRAAATSGGGSTGGGYTGGGYSSGGSQGLTTPVTLNGVRSSDKMELNLLGQTRELLELNTDDNVCKINILAGTTLFDHEGKPLTEIGITPVTSLPDPPAGESVIFAYDFQPPGARFSPAIKVTFKYDISLLPEGSDPAKLQVAYWDEYGKRWNIMEGTVDTDAGTISFSTTHFSIYGVIYPGVMTPVVTTSETVPVVTPETMTTTTTATSAVTAPETTLSQAKTTTPTIEPSTSTPITTQSVEQSPSSIAGPPTTSTPATSTNTSTEWIIIGIVLGLIVISATVLYAVRASRRD